MPAFTPIRIALVTTYVFALGVVLADLFLFRVN